MAHRMPFKEPPFTILKILIAGDTGAGKSQLIDRFVDGTYNAKHSPTIGVDPKFKALDIDENKIRLQIFDLGGVGQDLKIARFLYRNTKAFIIVYDLTNRLSFDQIPFWIKEIEEHAAIDTPIYIVGTKVDLLHNGATRAVPEEEVSDLIKRLNTENRLVIKGHEVSAKEKINVNEVFHTITKHLIPTHPQYEAQAPVQNIPEPENVSTTERSRFFHTGSKVTVGIVAGLLILCAAATIYFAWLPLLTVAIASLIGIPILSFVSGMISECFCYDKPAQVSEIELQSDLTEPLLDEHQNDSNPDESVIPLDNEPAPEPISGTTKYLLDEKQLGRDVPTEEELAASAAKKALYDAHVIDQTNYEDWDHNESDSETESQYEIVDDGESEAFIPDYHFPTKPKNPFRRTKTAD